MVLPKTAKGSVVKWQGTRAELKRLIEEHLNMLRHELMESVSREAEGDDDAIPPTTQE